MQLAAPASTRRRRCGCNIRSCAATALSQRTTSGITHMRVRVQLAALASTAPSLAVRDASQHAESGVADVEAGASSATYSNTSRNGTVTAGGSCSQGV